MNEVHLPRHKSSTLYSAFNSFQWDGFLSLDHSNILSSHPQHYQLWQKQTDNDKLVFCPSFRSEIITHYWPHCLEFPYQFSWWSFSFSVVLIVSKCCQINLWLAIISFQHEPDKHDNKYYFWCHRKGQIPMKEFKKIIGKYALHALIQFPQNFKNKA